MFRPEVDFASPEPLYLQAEKILENLTTNEANTQTSETGSSDRVAPTEPPAKISKQAIRQTLGASTLDNVFATIFNSVTTGVLLSNFLVDLGATSAEIGLLSATPMLANFLQPVGAYLADRTTSHRWYGWCIFGSSRLLWLILPIAIAYGSWHHTSPHQLVQWTVGIVFATSVFSALGLASWVSWMAALVPRKLRGRYFGKRNSAASLTSLVCVPLMGLAVSVWMGGTIQGYGVVLCLGVVAGLISLGCQYFMVDVNPLSPVSHGEKAAQSDQAGVPLGLAPLSILIDCNFLKFLLYFGLWTFAVNLSGPFFNIYLLKDLGLDVSWVTVYNSLSAGATLLMLLVWGKFADRLGNRPILFGVGILVAVTPLLWLGTSNNPLSLWLWLPLLHLLMGGTWPAIELCNNNIQMAIAPKRQPSTYFAIAAAVGGVSGALGTTAGGFLAELSALGGLRGLFALSVVLRLVALLPLVQVKEPRSTSLGQLMRTFLPLKPQPLRVQEPVPLALNPSGIKIKS